MTWFSTLVRVIKTSNYKIIWELNRFVKTIYCINKLNLRLLNHNNGINIR